MTDKAWKAWERRLAGWFPNGERRGADYRGEGNIGKSDVISEGWSIEAKLLKRPTWGAMNAAVKQAEVNRPEPDDIPVAVIKKKGKGYQDKDALVIMRLEEFAKYFINDK